MKVDREKALVAAADAVDAAAELKSVWSREGLATLFCYLLESQSHLWEREEPKAPELPTEASARDMGGWERKVEAEHVCLLFT